MKKERVKIRKTFGVLSLVLVLGAAAVGGMIGYFFQQRVLSRSSVARTAPISLGHNKYGDYLVGYLAGQNRDYDQMADSFERALQADPENEKLKTTVYLIKAVRGEWEAAVPLALELSRLKKPELLTDYVLIAQSVKDGQYPSALQILKHKPLYGADRILSPVLRLWLNAGAGDKKQALAALTDIKKVAGPGLYQYYRALAHWYFGDETKADEAFQDLSAYLNESCPSLSLIVYMRAFYEPKGLWQPGFMPYDRVQKLLSQSPSVREVIRHIPVEIKPTPAGGVAIAFYDISVMLAPYTSEETALIFNALATKLDPNAQIPQIWSAELMEKSGNHLAANRIYDQMAETNDIILLKKIMNLIAVQDDAGAEPMIKDLLSRNLDDGHLWLLYGHTLVGLDRQAEAVGPLKEAVRLFKQRGLKDDAGQALLSLGAVYDQLKQEENAEKALLEAIGQMPNNPQALNYLGYLWLESGKNIDQAFDLVKQAAELSPDEPNIMDSLALGYYLKQDYQKALDLAEKATNLLSFSSVAHTHLGDIYQALGREREAGYQYQKALDLSADLTPELAEKLKQKLSLTR